MKINVSFVTGIGLIIASICKFFGTWGMLACGVGLVIIAVIAEEC